jgi:diphosphomevalonate decarboxylase
VNNALILDRYNTLHNPTFALFCAKRFFLVRINKRLKMKQVRVSTHANIALIKYWGKRDEILMLPTKSSLSVTLAALKTTTSIALSTENRDRIEFDGYNEERLQNPVQAFLETTRTLFGINNYFSIASKNHFPTASGLASSASGFAALALGINSLCSLNLSMQEISMLARRGSGSAARSVYGGVVVWHRGENDNGNDSFAEQIFPANWWPELRVIIAITSTDIKKVSSRDGMQLSVTTSPRYQDWLTRSNNRLPAMITALRNRNIVTVGSLAQADWCDMRDVMLSTKPSLHYWNTGSFNAITAVTMLREQYGIACYVTTDAGPHVKIICLAVDAPTILQKLKTVPGVVSVLESTVAGDPEVEVVE